jgi:nitrogen regulatory protein PII
MRKNKVKKITCEIYKGVSHLFKDALQKAGIERFHVQAGRAIVLREKKNIFGAISGTGLDEDPLDIYKFYVPADREEDILSFLVAESGLSIPGRCTIYSEAIQLLEDYSFDSSLKSLKTKSEKDFYFQTDLYGISCIVQRGQGNNIAQAVLEMGICVPSITFGQGTGLRDKLGLLRITIPAEKEVVNLLAEKNDAQGVMKALIEAGKLDQPGKGFIYLYPVNKALINLKIYRGRMRYAASVEQIIMAVDDLKGSNEWRKKGSLANADNDDKSRCYLKNLVDLSLICNEGRAGDLVRESMAVGAAGATICRSSFYNYGKESNGNPSPAREESDMIVSVNQSEQILGALKEAGAFDNQTFSVIEMRDVPQACTYLGNPQREQKK